MSRRKLDVMFAERVLDFDVVDGAIVNDISPYAKKGTFPLAPGSKPRWKIPPYTESLDAAWTGVEKMVWPSNVSAVQIVCGGQLRGRAVDKVVALALVKACLLASGVTQTEIDAAEKERC